MLSAPLTALAYREEKYMTESLRGNVAERCSFGV